MKRLRNHIGMIFLLLISMYLTNIGIEYTKQKDPIMQKILKSKEKYEVKAVNATFEKETVIPGIYGVEINVSKSFSHMKKYGSYNESLTVLEPSKPDISTEDYYDFYIEKANAKKREVSLIFLPKKEEDFSSIVEVLKKKEVEGTIFLDGSIIEKKINELKENKNIEFEIASFQEKTDPSLLKSSSLYLESITKRKTKYCITEKENKNLLNSCKKEKKHTLKPKIIEENYYQAIKNNLENGMILGISYEKDSREKLIAGIEYLEQRGYTLKTVEQLLSEK